MTLHATRWGHGPAQMLFLHGFTETGESFAAVRPALEPRVSAIAVDLPGHGRTPPLAGGWDATVDALAALVTELGPGASVWGYSMGARLALAVALRTQISALILESGSPGLEAAAERAARREGDEARARTLEVGGIAAFVDAWEREPVLAGHARLDPETRAAVRARRLSQSAAGLAWSLRELGAGAQPSLWGRLPDVRARALLLAGARDEKFADLARRMQPRLARAAVSLVPGAAHAPHLEAPAAAAAAVMEFLQVPRGDAT